MRGNEGRARWNTFVIKLKFYLVVTFICPVISPIDGSLFADLDLPICTWPEQIKIQVDNRCITP